METDALQNLINRFKDFPVVERKPSFLEIAGFPHRETVWRNIFAFFFNPQKCHGLKDLFLRSFFDALDKLEQGTGDFDSMTVSTECQTEKGNYLDLLIRCHEFAIGIEMKVNAGLYNDLVDYGKLVEANSPDGLAYKVVFSNAPCEPFAGFVNLRYSDLIAAVQKNLGDYILGADPKYTSFLLDFLNHVTRYIGGYAMTIDPKQLQFLQDNHETVKRLIATHNTINDLLEQRMAQINDAVVLLHSLKALVIGRERLFSWRGSMLSKIQLQANQVRFWFQLSITDDYRTGTYYWVDQKHPGHQHLTNELKAACDPCVPFELSQPVEVVVAAIEKTILSLVDYLNKKQPPAAAQ